MRLETFCPAKWQEVVFNPTENYLYACCRSTPPTHINETDELEQQRQNLLNGIKDPSCEYCWKVEENNNKSLRHQKIAEWDGTYNIERLEINLGNLCNLYCSYCHPKFSSKWNSDLKKNGQYNIIFDKKSLTELHNPVKIQDTVYLDFIKKNQPSRRITFLGGEPLINPIIVDIINQLEFDIEIKIPTNLSFNDNTILNKIINTHNKITIQPSIDGVGEINSFLRNGFDFHKFNNKLQWLLNNTDVKIGFLTLVTAQSIQEFSKLQEYIHNLNDNFPNKIEWDIEYCLSPLTHNFNVLTNIEKERAITRMSTHKPKIKNEREMIQSVVSALENSKYNYLLRQDSISFFKQFADRNKISIPNSLIMEIE